MASGDLLVDLQNTVIDLIRDLRENIFSQAEEEGELMLVEFYYKRLHPEQVMQQIIKHVVPYTQQISERKLSFFIENEGIFTGLDKVISEDKIIHYRHILASGERFDEEDKEAVWNYFDVFVSLAEQYRKIK